MIEMRKMGMLLVASMLAICSIPAWAQFSFKKVEVRTSFGAAEEGNKGKLLIDSKRIRFTSRSAATGPLRSEKASAMGTNSLRFSCMAFLPLTA